MSSRKVRVKKLSVKTALPVLREDQIDPSEYEALTTESQIATGVEQAEENEYHLQSILKDAGTSNKQEIPVPPPEESAIDYNELYPSLFHKPSSYIRFSQTVEECISCLYDMTIEDDGFLREYNASASAGQLREDDFERIMEVYEDTAAEQTPFASVDNTVASYEMMTSSLRQLGSPSLLDHAKAVYAYWKTRRQEAGNKPLHPTLKYETHQASDDTDPYVCFRRREPRQTRKTRARDNKIAETLKRLRRELEDGRQLVLLAYEREMSKRELMQMDRSLFEERARLKQIKTKLKIRGEDEDLVHQKPQKRKVSEATAIQRASGAHPRMPVRPDGRTLDADLITLAEKQAERDNELRLDIEAKVQDHRNSTMNYIDLTVKPLSPVREQGTELKFRPAKTQYLMTPPASASSDCMDVDENENSDKHQRPSKLEKAQADPPIYQFKAGSIVESDRSKQPAFRRRIGRLSRLWIDRRGFKTAPRVDPGEYSDRWKYDDDSDEGEQPVYDIDPFDTRALKYRASIPLNTFLWRGRPPSDSAGNATGVNRSLPSAKPHPPQAQAPPGA